MGFDQPQRAKNEYATYPDPISELEARRKTPCTYQQQCQSEQNDPAVLSK